MEQIISKDGKLIWNVISREQKQEPSGAKQAYFTVACSSCGYQRTGRKHDIRNRKTCPGCAKKPAAVKTDDTGLCISICEMGTVEYVRDYQERHGVSEREAVRTFVETALAHLSEDDPIRDNLTDEKVRAKVRRETGKKKDLQKNTSRTLGRTAPDHQSQHQQPTWALDFATIAISQLRRIEKNDPKAKDALDRVIDWCQGRLQEIKG